MGCPDASQRLALSVLEGRTFRWARYWEPAVAWNFPLTRSDRGLGSFASRGKAEFVHLEKSPLLWEEECFLDIS